MPLHDALTVVFETLGLQTMIQILGFMAGVAIALKLLPLIFESLRFVFSGERSKPQPPINPPTDEFVKPHYGGFGRWMQPALEVDEKAKRKNDEMDEIEDEKPKRDEGTLVEWTIGDDGEIKELHSKGGDVKR